MLEKYKEILLPIIFTVIMSLVRSYKAGKTLFIDFVTEAVAAFLLGWLAFYTLTNWWHIEYNIVCGGCGVVGYLSPKVMLGFEKLLDTLIEVYKNKIEDADNK
jgi:hypothetical protein